MWNPLNELAPRQALAALAVGIVIGPAFGALLAALG